jgi:uncharacterized protein (TIGR01777 family)
MRILLAGASGFLGSRLIPHLRGGGHEVTQLVRRAPDRADQVRWDPAAGQLDVAVLERVDAVVNLAGVGVSAKRWTPEFKRALRDSRIVTTRVLAEAMARPPRGPRVLLNSSAVGYYGDTGDREVDEQAPPGEGFLADLCRDWEAATKPATEAGVRVALLRTGFPLSGAGGLLKPLLLQYRLGAGGPMAGGRQYQPWISLPDWLDAVGFVLAREDVGGPVNLTGPRPVTNAELGKALGARLHRPSLVPVPAFALRLVLGEFGDEAVRSQRVVPKVLLAHGFPFAQPTVSEALAVAV